MGWRAMCNNNIVSYACIENALSIKALINNTAEVLSKNAAAEVLVELVESIDNKILDALVDIDTVFEPDLRYSKTYFKQQLSMHDNTLLLMARIGSIPAGFCLSFHSADWDPETYFIDVLAVKEEYQGKGIGTALLKITTEIAKQLGYEDAILLCDYATPQGVVLPKFYNRRGFYIDESIIALGIPMCLSLKD